MSVRSPSTATVQTRCELHRLWAHQELSRNPGPSRVHECKCSHARCAHVHGSTCQGAASTHGTNLLTQQRV
eukprot:2866964-Pyramimonas_sp.AAC.1